MPHPQAENARRIPAAPCHEAVPGHLRALRGLRGCLPRVRLGPPGPLHHPGGGHHERGRGEMDPERLRGGELRSVSRGREEDAGHCRADPRGSHPLRGQGSGNRGMRDGVPRHEIHDRFAPLPGGGIRAAGRQLALWRGRRPRVAGGKGLPNEVVPGQGGAGQGLARGHPHHGVRELPLATDRPERTLRPGNEGGVPLQGRGRRPGPAAGRVCALPTLSARRLPRLWTRRPAPPVPRGSSARNPPLGGEGFARAGGPGR